MKCEIEFHKLYCGTKSFIINDVQADIDDFGHKADHGINSEDWCGDMQFIIKEPTTEVLGKYQISEDEYRTIADKLSEKLSFGRCNICD